MKAAIKYSKNIARAEIYIVGKVEESFFPWTQYSYGTVRGSKAASLAWRWEHKGKLSNQSISNILSLMWKDACLSPLLTLIDKYSGSLKKNWEIETYMVGIVSLQHFLCCVIRDFLKDFPQAKKNGRSHFLQVTISPSSSAHISSLLGLICPRRQSDEKKDAVLCLVFLPFVHFCAWAQTRGLTSRFPCKKWWQSRILCAKGKYASSGSCPSLCGCLPLQMSAESLA